MQGTQTRVRGPPLNANNPGVSCYEHQSRTTETRDCTIDLPACATGQTMQTLELSFVPSWAEALDIAIAQGGTLPTKEQLQANNVSAGASNMWHPALKTTAGIYMEWVQIGRGESKHCGGAKYCRLWEDAGDWPEWATYDNAGNNSVGSQNYTKLHYMTVPQYLTRIDLTTVPSWDEARLIANQRGATLPTRNQLIQNKISSGNSDLWHPVMTDKGTADWVQIGNRSDPCDKYCSHTEQFADYEDQTGRPDLKWGTSAPHRVGSTRYRHMWILKPDFCKCSTFYGTDGPTCQRVGTPATKRSGASWYGSYTDEIKKRRLNPIIQTDGTDGWYQCGSSDAGIPP